MIKDIIDPLVENIAIAAIPESNPLTQDPEWYIYLINMKEVQLEKVIVSSKGYGRVNDEKVETSQLRHFIELMPAKSFAKIEPIMDELFGLSNQYWVSFYVGSQLYDKKYVFLAETIAVGNVTEVPIMGIKGVLLS